MQDYSSFFRACVTYSCASVCQAVVLSCFQVLSLRLALASQVEKTLIAPKVNLLTFDVLFVYSSAPSDVSETNLKCYITI